MAASENLRPAALKKQALAQVFSCKFCEIFKKTFFTEHLLATSPAHLECVYIKPEIASPWTKFCLH